MTASAPSTAYSAKHSEHPPASIGKYKYISFINYLETLQKETQFGNKVIIATGRPFCQTIKLVENIGALPMTLLTCNGCLALVYPERKIIGYKPMDKNLCIPILQFLKVFFIKPF